jgi:hypothetical protein
MTRKNTLLAIVATVAIFALGCWLAWLWSSVPRSKPVALSTAADIFFMTANAVRHSEFLYLGKDGHYSLWERRDKSASAPDGNTAIALIDQGTWQQKCDCVLLLRSAVRLPTLYVGRFHVQIGLARNLQKLGASVRSLRDFLGKSNRNSFTSEDLWRGRNIFPGMPFGISKTSKPITTQEIEELIRAIEGYIKEPPDPIFRFTPRLYKGATFLVSNEPYNNYRFYGHKSVRRAEASVSTLLQKRHQTQRNRLCVMVPSDEFFQRLGLQKDELEKRTPTAP